VHTHSRGRTCVRLRESRGRFRVAFRTLIGGS
jgi:hypothetical protein